MHHHQSVTFLAPGQRSVHTHLYVPLSMFCTECPSCFLLNSRPAMFSPYSLRDPLLRIFSRRLKAYLSHRSVTAVFNIPRGHRASFSHEFSAFDCALSPFGIIPVHPVVKSLCLGRRIICKQLSALLTRFFLDTTSVCTFKNSLRLMYYLVALTTQRKWLLHKLFIAQLFCK